MNLNITSVQTHTIDQLLAPFGINDPNKGLYIIYTDASETPPPIMYPFRSDHFAFFIITQGELEINVNLMAYQLTVGNALMLSPQVVRQFVRVSPDCKIASVVFSSDFLSSAGIHNKNIDAMEFLSPQISPLLLLQPKEAEVLLTMVQLLKYKTDDDKQGFQHEIVLNIFAALIYEMGSLYKKQESYDDVFGTRKEELTFRFLKLLPQHYREQRSVLAYAAMLNITPKYLSQTIKEITGKTAGEFIDEMVLMEAKILLNDLSLTIGQVASYLNFSDQFFFSKYFKKQAGISPSQYRKSGDTGKR
ncbi:AraC family transcriptional regulator [Mucilaginibacter gynuensis]|uniref:AraC family transcriptional regulator n=1 Tax=Mucilaginibacter gynuensis TaxID=1302236 RepID=A0ABP8GDL2_9SPHI